MANKPNLLNTKRFLPLFITQFFGAFNDNVFKNAFLIWFTYDIAVKLDFSASIMATITSGIFILPFFLFSALAGQVADKFEKSKLIRLIKIAEIAIMIFAFVGFYFTNIGLLLTLIFLMGTHSTFFGPLKYSLLPEHLRQNELVAGNALIESGTFLAILLGTIFGSLVIRSTNGIAIISLAVVFFAFAGMLASRFIPSSKSSDAQLKISFNIWQQSRKIISYAKKDQLVWQSIIGISWFWFIGSIFLSQFPFYTKYYINGDEKIVTLFLTIFSVGIALGSAICNKILKGKIDAHLVPLGLIGMTCGIMIFSTASYFYPFPKEVTPLLGLKEFFSNGLVNYSIICGLLIISISAGIYIVPLYTIMQHHAEAKYLSRIVAANNILNSLFMVSASIITAALLLYGFNLLEVFLLVGLGNIFMFFAIKKIR